MRLNIDWTGLVDAVLEIEENEGLGRLEALERIAETGRYSEATPEQIRNRFYYELRKLDREEEYASIKKGLDNNGNDLSESMGQQQVRDRGEATIPFCSETNSGSENMMDAVEINYNEEYQVGDIISGTVNGIQPYGAFLELPNGESGLLHMSEMGVGVAYGTVGDYLDIGQTLTVKLVGRDNKGIKLSTRALGHNLVPKGMDQPPQSIRPMSTQIRQFAPQLRLVRSGIPSSASAVTIQKMMSEYFEYVSSLEKERDELKARVVELEGQLSDMNSKEHDVDTVLDKLRELVASK